MVHYCGVFSVAVVCFLGMAPAVLFGAEAGYFGGQEINYERLTYEEKFSTVFKLSCYIAKDEERHLRNSFRRLDRLLGELLVRYKIDENDEYEYSNLRKFLSGPHSFLEIEAILKTQLTEIPIEHLEKIKNLKHLSLMKAIKYLDEVNILPFIDGNDLFLKHSLLSPAEVVRLLENGIVYGKSKILVELKTGSFYGQALEMDDIVFHALKLIALKNDHVDLGSKESLTHVGLREQVKQLLLELFPEIADDNHAKEFISGAHIINMVRTYFMTYAVTPTYFWYRQPNINGRPLIVNNVNNTMLSFMPGSLSVMIIGNHYFTSINASTYHALNVDPVGLFYSGSVNMISGGPSWWVRYTDGYLGAGFNYSINFNSGAFWSTGQSTFLTAGGNISGWKDNISFGVNLATSFTGSTFAGGYLQSTINRTHEVSYLGEYPIDGKIKEIRGLHQIQVNDLKGAQLTGAVQVNFSTLHVPVTVAFRASSSLTKSRIYRTHRPLKDAQSMLKERGKAGLLYLIGRKIRYSKLPRFENPHSFRVGDELSETKIGKLMGGFMVGIESMSAPMHAIRLTVNLEVTAEFELGVKRWPNNKYEVEIELKKIVELSVYESAANILGLGQSLGAALAKKQVYLFDFNQPAARIAYFKLINDGKLPHGLDIEIYNKGRSAEYLISHFRAQNKILDHIGVQRIHLEKITIDSAKVFGGINAPIVPSMVFIINELDKHLRKSKRRLKLVYEPIDIGLMQTDSESIITNGLVSIVMNTHGGRFSQGQGFSGRYDEDLFVTHERMHTIDYTGQNKWKFHSLNITASFQDSVITGRQENDMVKRINRLFNLGIKKFAVRNSKTPRVVELKRGITKDDLLILETPEAYARLTIASYYSQLRRSTLKDLLEAIQGEHDDLQAQYLQQFLNKYNLAGFSALHMLLGGKPEDIILSSSAGYDEIITEAKMFIIDYSNTNENDKRIVSFTSKDHKKNRNTVKRFYRGARGNLREIDGALRRLYYDVFLVDASGEEMIQNEARQEKQPIYEELLSVRDRILEMLDLEKQGFLLHQRIKIYSYAQKKNRRFNELAEKYKYKWPDEINQMTSKGEIEERFYHCYPMIRKIEFRLRLHEEDEVIKRISQKHYDEQTNELNNILHDLRRIVSLDNLPLSQQKRYRKLFDLNKPINPSLEAGFRR